MRKITIFLVATFAAYAGILPFVQRALARDWHYFNALSLVVRSNILGYHRLPIHDPWVAGGVDILANPQSRVFSPLVLLDILFQPQMANLLSLMAYTFAGLWGMYLLLRSKQVEEIFAMIGAILFINCSWFGLHYAEGHIPFGAMQLLPWSLYLLGQLPSSRAVVGLHLLFAWMLLDGQIYPAIFSGLIMVSAVMTGLIRLPAWRACVSRWHWWMASLSGLVLITAPKTIPVLTQHHQRVPSLEVDVLGWKAALNMFFYPRHVIWASLNEPSHWGFHEYGCYIGFVAFLLVAYQLLNSVFRSAHQRYLILIGFWLWTAMGWFYPFNPWFIFQKFPLLKNAHVNSRVLILAFLFFVIVLVKSLQEMRRTKIAMAVCALLLVESFVLRNQAFLRQATRAWEGDWAISKLIESDTITQTVAFAKKPWHYYDRDTGSVATYEPAAPRTSVKATSDEAYRGEAFFSQGSGDVKLLEYTPGKIRLSFEAGESGHIMINTNTLDHWQVSGDGSPQLISSSGENLTVAVAAGRGEIELRYVPRYLSWIIAMYGLGCLIFVGLVAQLLKTVRSSRTLARNYDDSKQDLSLVKV
jgi:hypothetical protein